jgi:molybdopterin synthase sulfur carrier subunit
MPQFRIPGPLRRLSDGNITVAVDATDLAGAIVALDAQYPGFKDRLLDENGDLRQFVNVYLNDEDVRLGSGLGARVGEKDEISIAAIDTRRWIQRGGTGGITLAPMGRRRLKLIFGPSLVKEPVIYQLGRKFEIVTNIRRADVTRDQGWVLLEVSGESDELDKGVAYLESRGVKVEPAEGDLVE